MGIKSVLDKYPEKKIEFFKYWEDLDNVLVDEEGEYEKIFSQVIRGAIVYVLKNGIYDEYPGTGEQRRRRVLSASEIKEEVEKRLEEPVKKANLYFHLDKLETRGFIKVVETIASGKRNTTYYGRTAKVFSPKYTGNNQFVLHKSEAFVEIIQRLNPDIDKKEILNTVSMIDGFNNYDTEAYVAWLEKEEEHLRGLDIDFVELSSAFSLFRRYSPTVIEGLAKLADLLNLEQIEIDNEEN
ncbi:MAG: hypothetical protein ACXAD7_13100 [Candidatus Kariarchaeaceae archaeon]|jgi:DNA-binding PadR family transcriptional regulator